MTSNCRLHELLLIRGPIFPTNGIVPPAQSRPSAYTITPSALPPSSSTKSSSSSTPTTPKRRYSCPKCPYSTDRRDLYTRHENIHRDEKPFRCYVCEKMFNRADHVKKHFLRIHKGIEYDVKLTKRIKGRDYDVKDSSLLNTTNNINININNSNNNNNNNINNNGHISIDQISKTMMNSQTKFNQTQIAQANCFPSNTNGIPLNTDLMYKRSITEPLQIPKIAFNNRDNNLKFSHLQYYLQKPMQTNANYSTRLLNLLEQQASNETKNLFATYLNESALKPQVYQQTQQQIQSQVNISQTKKQESLIKNGESNNSIEKDDDYQCEYCGCSFVDYPSLHTHRFLFHCYIDNDNYLPYKCAVCGQRSITQRVMMKHMQRHNTLLKNRNETLANQNRVNNSKSLEVQKLCNSSNRRKQSQPRKIIKTFDDIASQDKTDFISDKAMITESKVNFTRNKFTCKICHKEFTTYTQLIQHQKFSKH